MCGHKSRPIYNDVIVQDVFYGIMHHTAANSCIQREVLRHHMGYYSN